MSNPLTPQDREDKGEVVPELRNYCQQKLNARFPSYFTIFPDFSPFLFNHAIARLRTLSTRAKRKIPLAAANMAIV
jgi:hypothetical protein